MYITIGIASAVYIIYDIGKRGHLQKMRIMDIVLPITAFYLGLLGLADIQNNDTSY